MSATMKYHRQGEGKMSQFNLAQFLHSSPFIVLVEQNTFQTARLHMDVTSLRENISMHKQRKYLLEYGTVYIKSLSCMQGGGGKIRICPVYTVPCSI